jgi:hypothetical protein
MMQTEELPVFFLNHTDPARGVPNVTRSPARASQAPYPAIEAKRPQLQVNQKERENLK